MPCNYRLQYICEKEKEVKVKPTNITTTVTPVSSITKSALVCHYTRTTIGCPSGSVINVNSAFWGRREKTTCTYVSVQPCGVKFIATITKNLKNKCDHFDSCDLHASELESYLNNPCPTVHKYLEVNYTCAKDTHQKVCKSGWTSSDVNKRRCYRLFDTPKTWKDARNTCSQDNGELLSIGGNLEQSFVTSLMERAWYSNVWIGLNDLKTKGVYEWSDSSSVSWTNWYAGQPDERRTDKSCVYMSLERGKRGLMYWSDQNCTSKYAFMCAYNTDGTTQKPTTVPQVNYGKCYGTGFVTKDNLPYCYYYDNSTNGQNWLDAQYTCRYNKKAKLVSVQSKEENEFVKTISKNAIWLGLEAKGVFRGHVWSDGQPVGYTNWDVGQPDSYNGLDACVEINPDTGLWSDRPCNEIKDVVCKKPRRINPVTPTSVIYPTSGSSQCKKGWTLYQGMCYIVGNNTSYDYLTWQDAEKKCQNLGNNGHLVSIHSQDEEKFVKFLIKSHYSSSFWIGLNDLDTEATYKWTDGSNYYYANWNNREPNDYMRQENCIHLLRYNGKWNDQHCQYKYPYVCKAYNESYKPPVKPTEAPRPEQDGYCPKGWFAHAQYCYEFHTHPSEYRRWSDARDACELGHNSSSYGELVSIHDEFEEAFITTHLKGATKPLWIGMNNLHRYYNYFWVDNSIVDYLKWNTREPRWGSNRCIEIVPYRWAAGRWNSAYCSKMNGYICKKAASKTPVTPTPTPKVSNCEKGYKSYDKSCFKFFNTKKTFDDAREVCQKDGGDLMIVDSQFRQAYLIYVLERYIGNVWIGFYHEPYSVFKFVDYRSAAHTYWGSGQPSRQLSQRSCTQANITGFNFGVWDDVDCGTTNQFVCEIYKGEPKVTIPLNGSCPVGWKYFNKHCYKHFSISRTWAAAQFVCASTGANLLSIHDDREQDFLIYYYQASHSSNIWTGLNDRAVERGYTWIDNSPLDYINWHDGEPNDYTGHENCIEMQTRSGQWNDLSCRYYRPFMCKKNIECSADIPLDSSMVTVTDTYNATSMGADKAILTDLKDYSSAWCTNNTSGTSKIMVDFKELVRVTGITVMGLRSQFVKSFRIDYERDENWRIFYPNRNFQSDIQLYSTYTSITKTFKYPMAADGLSITPITWSGDLICMKIRLQGCAYVCQRQLFESVPELINDNVMTASSAEYPTHAPKQTAIQGHTWCAEKNDKSPWIQFKFDKESVISVIRTFGDRKESYVMTYSMQFSEDGDTWIDYVQHGVKR
ncbi:macrophage mannose receptor 1-like, partial [Paramuricea clavata]